jgi:hypothetical protein
MGELKKKVANPKHKHPPGPDGKPLYSKGKETERKAAFALAYFRTRNAQEAYCTAYTAENMSRTSISVAANKIRKDPYVIEKLKELREDLEEETRLSLADLIRNIQEDRALAHREGQAAAAVQADMHTAKLLGYYWDRKVIITDDFEGMGAEQLRAYIAERTGALGIGTHASPLLIEHEASGDYEEDGEEEEGGETP